MQLSWVFRQDTSAGLNHCGQLSVDSIGFCTANGAAHREAVHSICTELKAAKFFVESFGRIVDSTINWQMVLRTDL